MGVTEFKTSPRHLNFLKQLKKTIEMMSLLRVLFLDTPGHPTSAPQYSNSSKYTTYAHYNQKFGHSFRPPFFYIFFLSHGRRNILMDSHPYTCYSYESYIFTLGAPHEEVQGRKTKLHTGYTLVN